MKHILVLSAGSVGKRHLRNFTSLGCKVSAMDPREDRLTEAAKEVKLEGKYTSVDEALKNTDQFDGVVIGSPPSFHIDQAISFIEKGVAVLMEKPLCIHLEEAKKLEAVVAKHPDAKFLLGYSYRWWPPLQDFYKELKSGKIGKLRHAKFIMSAHLADWHPWERYQDFFMAKKALGGGALLDESHFIDLMLWFFGMPEKIFAKVEHTSSLEIETDDNVDMIAVYKNGLRVTVHLDLVGRPHEKYISVMGEEGTVQWSFDPNGYKFSNVMEQKWEQKLYTHERNDMFMGTAKEFLDILNGKEQISCSLKNGIQVLQMIEACRESQEKEKMIYLEAI